MAYDPKTMRRIHNETMREPERMAERERRSNIELAVERAAKLVPILDEIGRDGLVAFHANAPGMRGIVAINAVRNAVESMAKLNAAREADKEVEAQIPQVAKMLNTAIERVANGIDATKRIDLKMGGKPGDHYPNV